MNYFIADILNEERITLFRQLSASKVRTLKAPIDGVRSYIIMLLPYRNPETERNVARFASFPDYHTAVTELLERVCKKLSQKFPEEKFYPSVDNSPIADVAAAVECGLGVLGKNGLLINRFYGSYCFIAEIATTMTLSESVSEADSKVCLNCGMCLDACPTGALSASGFVKEKCISHLTQKKGELTYGEQQMIRSSELIWGCDRCQEVCPMNSQARYTHLECFRETAPIITEEMINDPEFFDKSPFAWRRKETILRNIKLKK